MCQNLMILTRLGDLRTRPDLDAFLRCSSAAPAVSLPVDQDSNKAPRALTRPVFGSTYQFLGVPAARRRRSVIARVLRFLGITT
jgi:hypothetical protein